MDEHDCSHRRKNDDVAAPLPIPCIRSTYSPGGAFDRNGHRNKDDEHPQVDQNVHDGPTSQSLPCSPESPAMRGLVAESVHETYSSAAGNAQRSVAVMTSSSCADAQTSSTSVIQAAVNRPGVGALQRGVHEPARQADSKGVTEVSDPVTARDTRTYEEAMVVIGRGSAGREEAALQLNHQVPVGPPNGSPYPSPPHAV